MQKKYEEIAKGTELQCTNQHPVQRSINNMN